MPEFLPISRADMIRRGWDQCDFVYIIGDGYVDHPSFGHAIISRVLEDAGYKVGILSQPDWKDPASIDALGEPRLGFLVMGGNYTRWSTTILSPRPTGRPMPIPPAASWASGPTMP